ncbi:transcriptional regulator of AraC family [alpha proteobacterium U9-1i]|nr:transcriptional regulator of AraC family [alpha proteobacterium U9-1i]
MTRMLGTADLALLEAMFDALTECPFFMKDRQLRYVAANPAMARLCGVRHPEELIGRHASDVFSAPLARKYEAWDKAVLDTGRAQRNRLAVAAPPGVAPSWLLFSRLPVHSATGAVVGVAATARRLRPHDSAILTSHRLKLVVDRIQRRFTEPLNLTKLAALARISPSQLERDFVRLFGMTPQDFLTNVRMEHALALLDQNLSIAEIAYRCGYADQSAFTRRFRLTIGATPREYRARQEGKVHAK